jgi:hypothetical protein
LLAVASVQLLTGPQRARARLPIGVEALRYEHASLVVQAELVQALSHRRDAAHQVVRAHVEPAVELPQAEECERAVSRA